MEELRRQAKEAGLAGFRQRYQNTFFLVRLGMGSPEGDLPPESGPAMYNSGVFQYAGSTLGWSAIAAPLLSRSGLLPDQISIGRLEDSDIWIPLPYISVQHALILLGEDGGPHVVDQASRFGTLVNGREIPPGVPVPIRVGDLIEFGFQRTRLADARRAYYALIGPLPVTGRPAATG